MRTHAHMHAQIHTHMYTHPHTHAQIHTHMYTHPHTHTRTHKYTHTHTHVQALSDYSATLLMQEVPDLKVINSRNFLTGWKTYQTFRRSPGVFIEQVILYYAAVHPNLHDTMIYQECGT